MKIKMLETRPGSENGYVVTDYEAGKEYNVGDALGRAFIDAGCAEAVGDKPKVDAPADKPAPARKAK